MFYGLKRWRGQDGYSFELSLPLSDESIANIYRHFKRPIFSYVSSRIADHGVAEELTQEIFLKVHRFRESYQAQYALSTWLWTIARNTVSDHLRKGMAAHDDSVLPDDIPASQHCAEALIMIKDDKRRLLKIMKCLTRSQKRVLWMRVIHQLSYEEISRNLGISLASVKNLAYRAKIAATEAADLVVQSGASCVYS